MNVSPDLITCTDIIFITVHMNTGRYLRWLLIQREQNITCLMVESFETKINESKSFHFSASVYQFCWYICCCCCGFFPVRGFCLIFALICQYLFLYITTLDWTYRLLNLILSECSWRLAIFRNDVINASVNVHLCQGKQRLNIFSISIYLFNVRIISMILSVNLNKLIYTVADFFFYFRTVLKMFPILIAVDKSMLTGSMRLHSSKIKVWIIIIILSSKFEILKKIFSIC